MVKSDLKGYPCKITDGPTVLFGRIVGCNITGTWSCTEDGVLFSSPMIATPFGTIFETEQFQLADLEEEENDWQNLLLLEISVEGVLYGGNITLAEMVAGNEV